jgi:hypothetical protein
MEHTELKVSLTRDLSPYRIAKYLKEIYSIDFAPQRVYRSIKDGKLSFYTVKINNRVQMLVTHQDATNYILGVLNGAKSNVEW